MSRLYTILAVSGWVWLVLLTGYIAVRGRSKSTGAASTDQPPKIDGQ